MVVEHCAPGLEQSGRSEPRPPPPYSPEPEQPVFVINARVNQTHNIYMARGKEMDTLRPTDQDPLSLVDIIPSGVIHEHVMRPRLVRKKCVRKQRRPRRVTGTLEAPTNRVNYDRPVRDSLTMRHRNQHVAEATGSQASKNKCCWKIICVILIALLGVGLLGYSTWKGLKGHKKFPLGKGKAETVTPAPLYKADRATDKYPYLSSRSGTSPGPNSYKPKHPVPSASRQYRETKKTILGVLFNRHNF